MAAETPDFLAQRYNLDISSRPATNQIPLEWVDLSVFITTFPQGKLQQTFEASTIGKRFNEKIRPALEGEDNLAQRAASVFSAILGLRDWRITHEETGLQIPDAHTIQGWVNQTIHPDEFPKFVPPAFSEWAERLTDKPIPHITQANQWIAGKVAEHFSAEGQTTVKFADLGAGTGATINALVNALESENITVDITGVDLTPSLAELARTRTGKPVVVADALAWLESQPDESLDGISMVYAIHHMHYDDQQQLKELAFKKLKPKGIFAIADPTGRSKFNLENLDVNEPEATIACFQPNVVTLAEGLQKMGFSIPFAEEAHDVTTFGIESTEQGNVLDQGTLGYGVVAIKA